MRARLLLATTICVTMGAGTISCSLCTPTADYVGASPFPMDLWVGDKLIVTGGAESMNEFCGKVFESSDVRPQDYTFIVADTGVATVNGTELTGVGAGRTNLHTYHRTGGGEGTSPVYVARPIVSLRMDVTPASPKVGDTVTVVASPIDQNGEVTPGAYFLGSTLQPPTGTSYKIVHNVTDRFRFVALESGRFVVLNFVTRRGVKAVTGQVTIDVPVSP